MLFSSKSPLEKALQKVARYSRQGKLEKAILLLRELCQSNEENADLWDKLAELSGTAGLHEVQIAACFASAKLRHPPAAVWLDLAEVADRAGFVEDALDARFRAADSCAMMGESRRAIELCDQVLARSPGHKAADRIRQLMLSKLVRSELAASLKQDVSLAARPGTEGGEWEDATITFVGGCPSRARSVQVPSDVPLEETAGLEWLSTAPTDEAPGVQRDTEEAAASALVQFVLEPQAWPSVLDHRSLLFMGRTEATSAFLESLAEPLHLAAGEHVCLQGEPGHLLYQLDEGTLAASRERGGPHDLGHISAGFFFGDLGTLAGLPVTTSIVALEPAVLRFVSKEHLRRQLDERREEVRGLFEAFWAYYLEAAASLCPVLAQPEGAEPFDLESSEHVTFRPGELLADQDHAGPLLAILSGIIEVTVEAAGAKITLGHLCSSDVLGELDPSPVTARAVSVVSTIVVPRARLETLPLLAKDEVSSRIAAEERILSEALRTVERTMTGLAGVDGIDGDGR